MQIISDWFKRFLSDPQAVSLVLVLIAVTSIVLFTGQMLAPVFAGMVIAYLLEGLVRPLERQHIPRLLAVTLVFALFIAFVMVVVFGLMPLLSRQLTQMVQQLPNMLLAGQEVLLDLPARYPKVISETQVLDVISTVKSEIAKLGQDILSWSLASVVGFITILVYVVLVPMLVFFFLKDRDRLIDWFRHFMPDERTLAEAVWVDVDAQIGNYVRGKFIEILLVWSVTYVTFSYLDLQFAMLLSLMVGLSVIVPYIGAAVVTFPIVLIGFFQFGWGSEFLTVFIAYGIIQALDGNVLVPLLFSEVVDLHPIAIIVAVLVFGGVWGFWGVFFAIPLATVVQAVLKAWPTLKRRSLKLPDEQIKASA